MALACFTDPAAVIAALDRALAADPVRATNAGSIRADVALRGTPGWCGTTADGSGLATRSAPGAPVVLMGPWPDAALPELGALLAALPELVSVTGAAATVEALVPYLPPVRRPERERLYRLDQLAAPSGIVGAARPADRGDRDLLIDWCTAFDAEAQAHLPSAAATADAALADLAASRPWLWLDPAGTPVALANRRPVGAGSARVGPVYTPPGERGHGYGSAVTAAATADILADEAIPVLFADVANPTATSVYQRLGYYPVEDRLRVLF